MGDRRRRRWGVVVALLAIAAATVVPEDRPPPDRRPNVLLVVTDDQSFDTLPSDPPSMPWLQSQLQDPAGHWLWFPNAFASTPLCCPSRATILTGRYSFRTGVTDNSTGDRLDERETIATWLHDSGYTTALVGKYLNRYPWRRGPYVPPGWDRWFAKRNVGDDTIYYDYAVVDQGVPTFVGHAPELYATDLLAGRALDFLRAARRDRPWFLMFTPSAPHPPWLPAPRHAGAFARAGVGAAPLEQMNDVAGAPAWVRALPPIDAAGAAALVEDRRRERETLLAVDDALRTLVDEVAARGELGRTVIMVVSDNGFSFGDHRWVGKICPYEACVRTPFAVYSPWADGGTITRPASNADLAPTIAALGGVRPGIAPDGLSLAGVLRGGGTPHREGVLLTWHGGLGVPMWWAVRTERWSYIESDDGTIELYDVAADPAQVREVGARGDGRLAPCSRCPGPSSVRRRGGGPPGGRWLGGGRSLRSSS